MIPIIYKDLPTLTFTEAEELTTNWEKHFKNLLGTKPWSLQRMWARRVFLNRSFTIIAPTGIGKTTFGLSIATFINEKSYLIFPTQLLVLQAAKKLKDWGYEDNVLVALGTSKKIKEKIANGDFKILITTSMFLYKNYHIIPRDIKFFFVDDVDSFLKTAKNIDKLLYLMGFEEETIDKTLELINLRAKKQKAEEDLKKIEELKNFIEKEKQKIKSTCVVSSATANPKSKRIKLFFELLNFEVGRPLFFLRNITDIYYKGCSFEELLNHIKKLGSGGLVFVSSDKTKEAVDEIVKFLNENNIIAKSYKDIDEQVLEDFKNGKIDVLVGISSYRNPLARGVDIPQRIRYAIFYGVPKIVVKLDVSENQLHLLWVLASLRTKIKDSRIDRWVKILTKLKTENEELKKEILNFINEPSIQQIIKTDNEIVYDGKQLYIADVAGYLQASGRTSRLFAGGVSKGLTVILVDEERSFNNLYKKVRWYVPDIEFFEEKDVDLHTILKEIDEHRQKIKDTLENKNFKEIKDILNPLLIIVESPNKARTIANFFGRPIKRKVLNTDTYEVISGDNYLTICASFGHVFDLTTEGGIHGVELKDNKFVPVYEPIEGKENIINGIRLISAEYDKIFIATDPDTEGEKIAWDFATILNDNTKEIKRIEFHEVTKKAILEALANRRAVDEDLTKAQILRRIADRWVGFELSHYVQKNFLNNKLSAGRVQIPVLSWIIQQYFESKKQKYLVIIQLGNFKTEFEFLSKKEAYLFYKTLKEVKIKKLGTITKQQNPLPPYRTDTLLKDANEKFHFSLQQTMQLAQDLFESGLITYHRTDSIRVSDAGFLVAKTYISENFGNEFIHLRKWAEGGAHECIRPTRALSDEELKHLITTGEILGLNFNHLKLYSIIFDRFISSQMRPATVEITKYNISALGQQKEVEVIEKILENGYNLIIPINISSLSEGEFEIDDVKNKKFFKTQPLKYPHTHASIVAMMKERGIGRPSTYATIVEKLLERKYVIENKNFLIPTKLGISVYKFLSNLKGKDFFVKEEFTKELETLMDKVESGDEDYQKILWQIFEQLKVKKSKEKEFYRNL